MLSCLNTWSFDRIPLVFQFPFRMVLHNGTFILINCRAGMEYFVFTWSIFNALLFTTPSHINTSRNNTSKNTGVDKQNIRKLRSPRTSIRGHLPKLSPSYIYSLMLNPQVAISFQNAYVKASSVYAGKIHVIKNINCYCCRSSLLALREDSNFTRPMLLLLIISDLLQKIIEMVLFVLGTILEQKKTRHYLTEAIDNNYCSSYYS